MRYHLLGQTGLYVSEICLGTMTYGGAKGIWENIGGLPQEAVDEQVKLAVDAGINFIDTANVYSLGQSETLLGQGAQDASAFPRRDLIIVRPSPRGIMDETPNGRGQSRHHMLNAVDASLKRLRSSITSIYTSCTRSIRSPVRGIALRAEMTWCSGRVRYIGLCNMAAWQIMKALGVSERHGFAKFSSVQAYYTIAGRDLEREVAVPLLIDQKLGLMAWSPLAGGLLTGKYKNVGDKGLAGARRTTFDFPIIDKPRAFRCIDAMRKVAEGHGVSIAQVVLAWILSKPFVSTVIIGAKSMEQLRDNLRRLPPRARRGDEDRGAGRSEPPARGVSGMDDRLFRDNTAPRRRSRSEEGPRPTCSLRCRRSQTCRM